jgi:hypothetical protein
VVLLIPRDESRIKSSSDNIQRLKYVAITRAKKFATIFDIETAWGVQEMLRIGGMRTQSSI